MSDGKIEDKDLTYHPIRQVRKIAGTCAPVELEVPRFSEDDVDGLFDGITESDIEEGKARLSREVQQVPEYASYATTIPADSYQAPKTTVKNSFSAREMQSPVRTASSKRMGSLMDNATNSIIDFKRLTSGSVQLSDPDNGQIFETLSAMDFDSLLQSNEFAVM